MSDEKFYFEIMFLTVDVTVHISMGLCKKKIKCNTVDVFRLQTNGNSLSFWIKLGEKN